MRILVVGSYELGQQPLSVAMAAGALRAAGHEVSVHDLAVDGWDAATVVGFEGLAFSVPMHTASRLAVTACREARGAGFSGPVAFFGLYASAAHQAHPDGATAAGGLDDLAEWAGAGDGRSGRATPRPGGQASGTRAPVPDRSGLPPLERYAVLQRGDERVRAGATAASEGCRHRCRHCPVPVVWDGRIRVTAMETVLADADQLVEAGMGHLSFVDPDFLNAPAHARRIVAAVHARHPALTWDCTVKVEHILAHRDLWPAFADCGLEYVTTAVETLDDRVLALLDKGHRAADATEAVQVLRAAGVAPRPSLLPFGPWTTDESLGSLLRWVASNDLVGNVDPVQYTVRLLLPPGSLLLDEPEVARAVTGFDPGGLAWSWEHPDPAIDALQQELAALVEAGNERAAGVDELFPLVWNAVGRRLTGLGPAPAVPPTAALQPRMSEAWFCCSEPTSGQLARIGRPTGNDGAATGR